MKCPNCKESTLAISERQGIEIDYCPDCRGIWLDRGELDKLLERTKEMSPENNQYAPPQASHPGSYQKPYKRKKSFLEELFD